MERFRNSRGIPLTFKYLITIIILIPRSKGQKVVRACTIRLWSLGLVKHEKVAIYVVNQRISNV